MTLSIIFFSNENAPCDKIDMEEKTKYRGNREIFKANANITIEPSGYALIYENNKEKDKIYYHINDKFDWKQLNTPTDNYVIQVKFDESKITAPNLISISKIAIQKIIGEKNILLNI